MPDNIARAYADNEILQILLNDRISSKGLDLPIPTWFLTLRLTTKGLNRPTIDDAVCHALAQHVRKVNESRANKTNAQEEVQAATEAASKAIEAAKKRIATEDAEKRMFAAETREKIWRKQAHKMTHTSAISEKRINNVNVTFKKGVESLHKKLESLESRLEKAKKNSDEEAQELIKGDVKKTKDETEKIEKIRVMLLEAEMSVLRATNASLQHEKVKFEIEVADLKVNSFTPDSTRIEKLEEEIGVLREDRDITTGERYSLEDKYSRLDQEHAQLEVRHAELTEKYESTKTTLDKAKKRARARKSNVSMIEAENAHVEPSTVDKGKKRAALEDMEMGSVMKKAKMGVEVLAGMDVAQQLPELTSREKTMSEVQKRVERGPQADS